MDRMLGFDPRDVSSSLASTAMALCWNWFTGLT